MLRRASNVPFSNRPMWLRAKPGGLSFRFMTSNSPTSYGVLRKCAFSEAIVRGNIENLDVRRCRRHGKLQPSICMPVARLGRWSRQEHYERKI